MPRVAIPVTQIVKEGAAPPATTPGDAANDHVVAGNDGRIFVEATNSAGGAADIIFETPGNVGGLTIADLTVNIGAGLTRLIGPFPPAIFNQVGDELWVNVAAATWALRAYHL